MPSRAQLEDEAEFLEALVRLRKLVGHDETLLEQVADLFDLFTQDQAFDLADTVEPEDLLERSHSLRALLEWGIQAGADPYDLIHQVGPKVSEGIRILLDTTTINSARNK